MPRSTLIEAIMIAMINMLHMHALHSTIPPLGPFPPRRLLILQEALMVGPQTRASNLAGAGKTAANAAACYMDLLIQTLQGSQHLT